MGELGAACLENICLFLERNFDTYICKDIQDIIDRIMSNDPDLTDASFHGNCFHLHDAAAACC